MIWQAASHSNVAGPIAPATVRGLIDAKPNPPKKKFGDIPKFLLDLEAPEGDTCDQRQTFLSFRYSSPWVISAQHMFVNNTGHYFL